MTASEKRLLKMAGTIFILFAAFYLLPQTWQLGKGQWESIERLELDIERLKSLDEDTQFWIDTHQQVTTERERIDKALLQGDTRELVGARMQGTLRRIATRTQLRILSMEIPEFNRSNEWVLVTLGIRFQSEAASLMEFLQAIEKAEQELVVAKLEVRTNRNQLNGTVQITGFSRVPMTEAELSAEGVS